MSIKITPDKYPQIIAVYNTEGKTAAYDLMRSCYEIKNPTSETHIFLIVDQGDGVNFFL